MLVRKFSLGLIKKAHSSKDLKETRELTVQIIWVPGKVPEFDKISVAGMEWMKRVTRDRVGLLWGLEGQVCGRFHSGATGATAGSRGRTTGSGLFVLVLIGI